MSIVPSLFESDSAESHPAAIVRVVRSSVPMHWTYVLSAFSQTWNWAYGQVRASTDAEPNVPLPQTSSARVR